MRKYDIPEGSIYCFFGKQPLFVPSDKALNEQEAAELKNRLKEYEEKINILQKAVRELTPLHVAMNKLNIVVNPLYPVDPGDTRMEELIKMLSAVGYWNVEKRGPVLWSHIKQPEKIANILEDLGI